MAFSREDVYTALLASLQALGGFTTVERRLRHWDDVSKEEQPYLGVSQAKETADTITGLPTAWIWQLDLYLYVNTEAPQAPGAVLNPLLDAICNKINEVHIVTGKNVLGLPGDVQYCRVQGTIETDEGTLGDQAVAIIPVVIYVIQQP